MAILQQPWGWIAWLDANGQPHSAPILRKHHRHLAKIRASALRRRPDIQRVWISRTLPRQ